MVLFFVWQQQISQTSDKSFLYKKWLELFGQSLPGKMLRLTITSEYLTYGYFYQCHMADNMVPVHVDKHKLFGRLRTDSRRQLTDVILQKHMYFSTYFYRTMKHMFYRANNIIFSRVCVCNNNKIKPAVITSDFDTWKVHVKSVISTHLINQTNPRRFDTCQGG